MQWMLHSPREMKKVEGDVKGMVPAREKGATPAQTLTIHTAPKAARLSGIAPEDVERGRLVEWGQL